MDGDRFDRMASSGLGLVAPKSQVRPSRRGLLALIGGGLAALAWGEIDQAHARPGKPGRRHRHRGNKQSIDPTPDPVACDAASPSGISGTVTIGPTCPVERIDDPCPDRPYAATFTVQDDAGHDLCTVQSGDDGHFRVGLPPGAYELVPVIGPSRLPYAQPQQVTVTPNQYTEVSIGFDSGIR
jgi:hypothetical protein